MNALRTLAVLLVAAASAPSCLRFHLIYPKQPPTGIVTWTEEADRGDLRVHLEGARPAGAGPFAAVLVHPDAGHGARPLQGALWDLAAHGYLAVAADYRRRIGDAYLDTLFPWREPDDATAALDLLRADPRVDRSRIAALGFSRGAVFSLLLAARAPELRAVVAYYPVTDLARWLERRGSRPMRRYFLEQSGARDEAELRALLAQASPLEQAASIEAAVLLVHGARDRTVPVEESERLAARLQELHRTVELVVVAHAGHVFNFKDRDAAAETWEKTLRWLDRYVSR